MTPEKLKLARHRMGYSVNEMADALRLSPANGGTTIRKMEAGKVNITGPIMVAVDAMLKGYDPFCHLDGDEDDQGKLDQLDPKMVTCPKCQHEFDSREATA